MKAGIIALAGLGFVMSAFIYFFPVTGFKNADKIIVINSVDINQERFIEKLLNDSVITSKFLFNTIGNGIGLWSKIKPGKYKIKKNTGLLPLVLQFSRKEQVQNKLVIHKIRTREQFAELVGKNLECNEQQFLEFISNNDSLKKWAVDTSKLLSIIIPDTYFFDWNATPAAIVDKLSKEKDRFWNESRTSKAAELNLTPLQLYILASLVEEETTIKEDKPLIAGVYLNRFRTGMLLGSCPTIKYALRDFSLRRILNEHVVRAGDSPFNTYKFRGLPPGPICTPSRETLEAALNASKTDYLYFCAKANSGGRHAFSKTYEEHLENARIYQKWLDEKKIR